LKWAGGKRWLVPVLAPMWDPHKSRRLVEPLCGGLAVALGLAPHSVLINDINPHAINFYRWLKSGLRITLPMKNDSAFYYARRARFNRLIARRRHESSEAAGLFYYLNRTCYNGLCRFNSRGEFNVPFGRYDRIDYKTDFAEYRRAFSRWEFRSSDFQDLPLEPTDFIYADPPYDVEFTRYAQRDFAWDDQVRLARWLARHGGPVVLSNQATDRIVRLYKELGFKLRVLSAPRLISCNGDRTRAREVLAMRNI
jgi:DNA adenine methylase